MSSREIHVNHTSGEVNRQLSRSQHVLAFPRAVVGNTSIVSRFNHNESHPVVFPVCESMCEQQIKEITLLKNRKVQKSSSTGQLFYHIHNHFKWLSSWDYKLMYQDVLGVNNGASGLLLSVGSIQFISDKSISLK